MLMLLKMRMPLSTPLTAQRIESDTRTATISIWFVKLLSDTIPNDSNPELICTTPKPNVVVMPKNVLQSAKISMVFPQRPFILSLSSG